MHVKYDVHAHTCTCKKYNALVWTATPNRAHLQPGDVGVESLHGLGVVESPVSHGTAGRSHREGTAVEQIAGAVAVLGRLVHQLYRELTHHC